jgi:2-(3-amino-3-carboxypropyl)histidine synthase
MRILLQFPEGLKRKGLELAKDYESEGHEVFLSASACYGACDLALDEARWIKADKIVHVGHNRFIRAELPIPVEYVPYPVDIEIGALAAALPHLEGYTDIALGTTVQHVHQFGQMKEFLESNGKRVFAEAGEMATEKGQVLGCDASAITKVQDKVEAVLFVGSGMFHPLAIDIDKPVFVFNPNDGSVKDVKAEVERLRKRRKGAIAKALTCQSFGILLSTKPGQFNMSMARWARDELRMRGLSCAILVSNELDPMSVNNYMDFEAYVNTACPRLSDDQERYGRPVLNIGMLKQMFSMLDG